MIKTTALRKAWALLDAQERRSAIKVLAIMVLSALGSAVMVGSVFPFLAVLSDPGMIQSNSKLSWLYDVGGFTSSYSFLYAIGICSITVILLSNLLLIVNTWTVVHFTSMRIHAISARLMAHYLAQPYTFFLSHHSGTMTTNILSEAQQAAQQFIRPVAEFISASLTVTAVVVTLLIVNPLVATASIVVLVTVYGGVMIASRKYVRLMGKRRAEANEVRYRVAGEAFGGIKDIKLLGHEAEYLDRFSKPSFEIARAQIGEGVISQAPRYAVQILAFGGIIVLCLVMLDPQSLQERNALGGLLPTIGLLAFAGQRMMPELQKMFMSLTQMTAGTAALDRVYEDLHSGASLEIERDRPAPLGLKQTLELKDICYTYPKAERQGLSEIDLEIRAGERIGVVGCSGAGKTTLADVILGLLAPEQGSLFADGRAVTTETLRAWQQSVGYVPQDIFLIDASLSENIALGFPLDEIDDAKVERAARIAQIHDFAMKELPEGYGTHVGERGVRLSGGQRQRIGIARALYNDADLIVFDEATSALDNMTEREVMAAIETLPGDKTILMIAHRLSTVKVCDRIVVMENGRITGVGEWDTLMLENAAFQRIARVV
ncbi:ABC transporter ATP-binding protein [Falsihalocynthiibacter sp. S25ZX9]|uniref:ABC transporter ATP-binding protein n=1 Tax=Falsihalocynthiibacter sp. S25ZX9 TaxID=3240870 RepID=UPI00350EBC9A